MKEAAMGIVIRVAFNDKDWKGACLHPLTDPMHYQCREHRVNVGPIKEDSMGFCTTKCWERELCNKYRWENVLGDWGTRAYSGANVYFVYRQPSGLYTLWGKSQVSQISGNEIFFTPFQPLAKWKTDLRPKQDLVGKDWKQGFYRYIDAVQEDKLDRLIEGGERQFDDRRDSTSLDSAATHIEIALKPHIAAKLQRIAEEEGREIEDVVREAIGEWLKSRGA